MPNWKDFRPYEKKTDDELKENGQPQAEGANNYPDVEAVTDKLVSGNIDYDSLTEKSADFTAAALALVAPLKGIHGNNTKEVTQAIRKGAYHTPDGMPITFSDSDSDLHVFSELIKKAKTSEIYFKGATEKPAKGSDKEPAKDIYYSLKIENNKAVIAGGPLNKAEVNKPSATSEVKKSENGQPQTGGDVIDPGSDEVSDKLVSGNIDYDSLIEKSADLTAASLTLIAPLEGIHGKTIDEVTQAIRKGAYFDSDGKPITFSDSDSDLHVFSALIKEANTRGVYFQGSDPENVYGLKIENNKAMITEEPLSLEEKDDLFMTSELVENRKTAMALEDAYYDDYLSPLEPDDPQIGNRSLICDALWNKGSAVGTKDPEGISEMIRDGYFLDRGGRKINFAKDNNKVTSEQELYEKLMEKAETDGVYFPAKGNKKGVYSLTVENGEPVVSKKPCSMRTLNKIADRELGGGPKPIRNPFKWISHWFSRNGNPDINNYLKEKTLYDVRKDTFLRSMNCDPPMSPEVEKWKKEQLAKLYADENATPQEISELAKDADISEVVNTPEAQSFFRSLTQMINADNYGKETYSFDLPKEIYSEFKGRSTALADKLHGVFEHETELENMQINSLEELEKTQVKTAANGREARDRLTRQKMSNVLDKLYPDNENSAYKDYLKDKLYNGSPEEQRATGSMTVEEIVGFKRDFWNEEKNEPENAYYLDHVKYEKMVNSESVEDDDLSLLDPELNNPQAGNGFTIN